MNDIVPIPATSFTEPFATELREGKLTKEEKMFNHRTNMIAEMASHEGWGYAIEDVINPKIEGLRKLLNVGERDTVEQAGFKFLTATVVEDYLNSIIDEIEGIRNALIQERRKPDTEE